MNKFWKFINKYIVHLVPLVIICVTIMDFIKKGTSGFIETESGMRVKMYDISSSELLTYTLISIVGSYILYFLMHKFMWWRWSREKNKLLREGRVTVTQIEKADICFRWMLSIVWGGLLYLLFHLVYSQMLIFRLMQDLSQF